MALLFARQQLAGKPRGLIEVPPKTRIQVDDVWMFMSTPVV